MSKQAIVQIWTDGACKGNPGPGGWGIYMKYKDPAHAGREMELFGGELQTTNNRMEMMAVIKALEFFKQPWSLELYVDSQYVKKGLITNLYKTRIYGCSSWRSVNDIKYNGIGLKGTAVIWVMNGPTPLLTKGLSKYLPAPNSLILTAF